MGLISILLGFYTNRAYFSGFALDSKDQILFFFYSETFLLLHFDFLFDSNQKLDFLELLFAMNNGSKL